MDNQSHTRVSMKQTKPSPRVRRRTPKALVLLGAVGLLSSAAVVSDVGETVDKARATLEKWVETKGIISKEKRDWRVGKELLEDRVELLQREIEAMRARVEEAKKSIADADKKREELVEENERLKTASTSLTTTAAKLEADTKALDAVLPDPLRAKIKPLVQRIPTDPENTESSLSERFQNVVGTLDQVNRFHRELTVTNELRTLEGGAKAEVNVLYLGVGKAYYATTDGLQAGVGTATQTGWVWETANDSAAEIAQAIAILRDGQVAAFVRVPVNVQ